MARFTTKDNQRVYNIASGLGKVSAWGMRFIPTSYTRP